MMKIVEQSVADFYAGKSVFITGGTGFGKALIEKLFYSCKDIEKIFILIRDKKGVSVEERLQQMIKKPVFTRLIGERSHDLKKIIPITGDITQPRLGLSSADQETRIEKVSVVFHVAATIKFNETLDLAVITNVKGTEHVLNLCHQIKNIKAFIHVSTAYCNMDHKVLEEKVYPCRVKLSEVQNYVKQPYLDPHYICKQFFKGLPNTYTFTKGLAENYVAAHCRNIPTVIIRPSIAPIGLDWFGSTGLVIASVKGANRVLLGDGNNILDIIPVDYVTNVTIVAAAKCSSSKSVTVYNCCTSSCNPVLIKKFVNGVKNSAIGTIGFGVNSNKPLMFTNNKCVLHSLTFLLRTIPAYIADLFRWVMGRQLKYVKLHTRVIIGRKLLEYFTSHSWEMKADNVKSLHASLSHSDKNKFPCDPSDINWVKYTTLYLDGVRRYPMNQQV